jgi:hypothetical protein
MNNDIPLQCNDHNQVRAGSIRSGFVRNKLNYFNAGARFR